MSLFSGLSVPSNPPPPPSPPVETDGKESTSGGLFSGLGGGGSAFNFIAEEPSVSAPTEGGLSAFNFIGSDSASGTSGPSAFGFLGGDTSSGGSGLPSSSSAFNFTSGGVETNVAAENNSSSMFNFLTTTTNDAPSMSVDLLSVGLSMDTAAPPSPSPLPTQQSLPLDTFSEPAIPRKKTRKAMLPGHAARNAEVAAESPEPSVAPASPPTEEVEPTPVPISESTEAPSVFPRPSIEEPESAPPASTSILSGLSQVESEPVAPTASILAGLAPAEKHTEPEAVSSPPVSILAGLSQAAPREVVPTSPQAAPPPPPPPAPPTPVSQKQESPVNVTNMSVEPVQQVQQEPVPSPPAEMTLDSMPNLDSTQQWMELRLSSSMEEQRALLEQQAACLARSQKMTSDVVSLRQQLASTEADQNRLCDAEQFEEAEALEANIQQLKDAITRRLEEVAGTSRQMETLARSLLDLTRQREDLAEQVLKKMHSLQSDGSDSLADLGERAQRRLAAESNRIESEKKRIELACSHLKKDSENLDEEKQQLQEAIEQQTTIHVQERDKAVSERTVMDDEIKELQKTLEARLRQRKTLSEIVDSCEIRIASIKSKFEKQLTRLDGKQKRLEEAQREVETDAQQVEQMASEHQRERKTCTEEAAQRKRQLDEIQKQSRKLLRMRKVMSRHLCMRSRWQRLLEPHQELLNKARLRWESFTGDCLAQASSLAAREAESSKMRSQLDAIRIQMPTLEAEKKVAVASRSFKEAGRLSEEIKKREEERKTYETELETLQNELTTQRENLASSRQLEEGAQAELMEAEAKSGAEELRILQRQIRDLDKLRRNSCMGATERILFEEEERVFKSAQSHLAEKCGISLDTLEGIPSEDEDIDGDATSEEAEDEQQSNSQHDEANRQALIEEAPGPEEVVDVEALRQRHDALEKVEEEKEQRLSELEKEIEQACELEQYDKAEELEAERLEVEKVLSASQEELSSIEKQLQAVPSSEDVGLQSESVDAATAEDTAIQGEESNADVVSSSDGLQGITTSTEPPESSVVASVDVGESLDENPTVTADPDVNATEESSAATSGFSFVGRPPVEVTEETEAPSGFSFVEGSSKPLEEEPESSFSFVGGSGGTDTLNADGEANHEDEASPEAASEEAF